MFIHDFSHLLYYTKFPIYTRLAKPVTGGGSCTLNSFRGSTGLFRGLILTEYEALDMEYKVLACPWIIFPLQLYGMKFLILTRLAMSVAGPANRFFFAGQLVYPWSPILIEYIHMEPKYGIQGVSPLFLLG